MLQSSYGVSIDTEFFYLRWNLRHSSAVVSWTAATSYDRKNSSSSSHTRHGVPGVVRVAYSALSCATFHKTINHNLLATFLEMAAPGLLCFWSSLSGHVILLSHMISNSSCMPCSWQWTHPSVPVKKVKPNRLVVEDSLSEDNSVINLTQVVKLIILLLLMFTGNHISTLP